MPLNHFSALISPTYRCNADCEYCFEHKTSDVMEVADFELILQRIVTYLRQQDVTDLTLYWQGGEIFTMPPEWLLRAHDICREISEKSRITYHQCASIQPHRLRAAVAPRCVRDVQRQCGFVTGLSQSVQKGRGRRS